MEYIAIFAPLMGAFLAMIAPSLNHRRVAELGSSVAVACSALASLVLLLHVPLQEAPRILPILTWVASGGFEASWTVRLDPLSATMLLVISWVSAAVHVYSIGYMKKDEAYGRYFGLLSLLTFFMVLLVVSNDFMQLYFAWEGIGLCSYLLMNFWHTKAEADDDACKSFILNRVGDLGFAVGIIMAIFLVFGTLRFDAVFAQIDRIAAQTMPFLSWDVDVASIICLLLLAGAIGKSAQLGLHVWLPDAMEAPTPVSALLCAATMVTAGVFLIVRLSPLFEHAPLALDAMILIGAITALMAGTIALVQTDIKRIIAYSTMSQIGFMFLACGVSAYGAAMFHLVTHAFFMGLLFLGAGCVIRAANGEQDVRRMGGLWDIIPLTYGLMVTGCLAIVGMPGLSGFYSKEAILAAVHASPYGIAEVGYLLGIVATLLTGLYSSRLIYKTFHGQSQMTAAARAGIYEPTLWMLVPAGFLAVGTVFIGSQLEPFMIGMESHSYWAADLVLTPHTVAQPELPSVYFALLATFGGLALGWLLFLYRPQWAKALADRFHPVTLFLTKRWYFDRLYVLSFARPTIYLAERLGRVVGCSWIGGLGPRALTNRTRALAALFCRSQTSHFFDYAFVMVLGLVGLVTWLLFLK